MPRVRVGKLPLPRLTVTRPCARLLAVPKWSPDDMPKLTGRVALVTGANSGIGFEAARALARAGAHVVLACRDSDRARVARERIERELPSASVETLALDLASLESVRKAALRFADGHERLHVLCNNAGVMAIPRLLTADGFEMQLGVNHFGHFALTGLLLGPLLRSGGARVVSVSSLAHRTGRMRFDDLDGAERYQKWEAYCQSKLANLLFAYELDRRLRATGAEAISVACHPGYANTNLQQVGPALFGSGITAAFFRVSNALLAQSAHNGAWPTLFAATAQDVQGGDYIGPGGPGELAGAPKKVRSTQAAQDLQAARRLWQISVERTNTDYAALG
jgi:NAD(P)-dependent dehydrogenase (short-subunit alcohol dehydrogenase family)